MNQIKCLHILVNGTVQGVFYRASTKTQAEKLGINGWVRNLPDGRVEMVVQGDPDKIDQLKHWCKKGPILAKVTGIDVEELGLQELEGFEIRY